MDPWSLFGHLPRVYQMINEEHEVQRLLRETLDEPSPFKYVLDPSASNGIIKNIKYDPNNSIHAEQNMCCVSLDDFQEGDNVSELPCHHIFKPNELSSWLNNEKAECPICRFKLPCMEIRNPDVTNITDIANIANMSNIANLQNLTDIATNVDNIADIATNVDNINDIVELATSVTELASNVTEIADVASNVADAANMNTVSNVTSNIANTTNEAIRNVRNVANISNLRNMNVNMNTSSNALRNIRELNPNVNSLFDSLRSLNNLRGFR